MKPDWDRLIKEFNPKSKTGYIGDVDCTAGGKPLCEENGVQGYPTLKWGDPNALQDYEGGRDYDTLLKFAKDKLVPLCSPGNMEPCNHEERAEIEKFQEMSDDSLEGLIKMKEEEIETIEAKFKKRVEKLQKKYQKAQKRKDNGIAAVKASGLGLMKSVRAHKKKSEKGEL